MRIVLSLFILFTVLETSYADKYDELVYRDVKYEYPDNYTNLTSAINNKEYQLTSNNKITIGFSNGRVFGSSGVNRYMGTYEIKDSSIIIKGFGATMMMGPEEAMEYEQEFLQWLDGKHTISISYDNLTLDDKGFIFSKKVE